MSNVLLNKLKTIDASRRGLEQILNNKGLNLGTGNGLNALIGNVNRLNLYEDVPETWEGVETEEEPLDYYKGDDDWKNLIDIQDILSADPAPSNFTHKLVVMWRISDNSDFVTKLNSGCFGSGIYAYRTSQEPNTIYASDSSISGYTRKYYYDYTWNPEQDIIASNGEHFRWMEIYAITNHTASGQSNYGFYWNSKYFLPEAVWYVSGYWSYLCIQDNYVYYMRESNGSGDTRGDASYYNNSKCPKYVEMFENCSCAGMMGVSTSDIQYIDKRLRTCILNGTIRYNFNGISALNLEYFRVANIQPAVNGQMGTLSGISGCTNPAIRTRIYYKGNYYFNVSGFFNINNAYIEIDKCNSLDNFRYNIRNVSFKLHDIKTLNNNVFSNSGRSNGDYCVTGCEYEIDNCWTVGSSAFYYNEGHILIHNIENTVDSYAFYQCTNLCKNIIISCNHETSDIFTLGAAAFTYSSAEKVDMSNSRIGYLPNNNQQESPYEQNMGRFGFYLSNVKYIYCSPFLQTIPYYGFGKLYDLEVLTLPSVKTINSYAFAFNNKLKSCVINDNVTSLGTYVFYGCQAMETATISADIQELPGYTFFGCSSLTEVTLSNSMNAIGEYAFQYCEALQEITLPDSIKILKTYCFANCVALQSVLQATSNITTINSYAFFGCASLETLFNTDKVKYLYEYAFKFCRSLQLTLPKNVDSEISQYAYCYTGCKILLPSDFYVIKNMNLNGAEWNISNFVDFIQSLPDRTGLTKYTLYLGASIDKINPARPINDSSHTSNENFYSTTIKNGYVHEDSETDKLIWTDSSIGGDTKVSDYVAAKNWTLE